VSDDRSSSSLVALLHGPDRPGLVAGVAGWIYENGGNILHADQHDDATIGYFFQRIEWSTPAEDPAAEAAAFRQFAAAELGMSVQVMSTAHRPRVVVFVSRRPHACRELILDWDAGELPCEIVGVVSNHPDFAETAAAHGIPFHHIPVDRAHRPAAELRQLGLLRQWHADLVVLARYMQILSADFVAQAGCPIINIHHSFLPAFSGARPYHQAHGRGVKLIGATAHYVTADLDEGPIIHQDVRRISHRDTVEDLLRKGRNVEKLVLGEAVRLHLEHRVLVHGNKTLVFD
jgi:formyltetrahydrofolate deformylase